MKIAFSGHRPIGLPWGYNENSGVCIRFKQYIKTMLTKAINCGFDYFISGMAMGVDLIMAEMVLQLKKEFKYIRLECALPCENQDKYWSVDYQKRYKKVLSSADKITYISKNYISGCMEQRNRYMVDNCEVLVAVFNGKAGGTLQTIKYAQEKNCRIKIINPSNFL